MEERNKKMKELKEALNERLHLQECVIVYALRYALRRDTGALLQILTFIKNQSFTFTEQTKEDILREIEWNKIHHKDSVPIEAEELKEYLNEQKSE